MSGRRFGNVAATKANTRKERNAIHDSVYAGRGLPEIVTVERTGVRLHFRPAAIAAQLGVPPQCVRIRRTGDGRVFVSVYRTMHDKRFGFWEEFEAELMG